MDIQEEIAQAIANSFFGMEAGRLPTEEWEMPVPNAGHMQLAFDVMPLVKRAQAEALREAAEVYRSGQLTGVWASRDGYTQDWLRDRADRIERAAGGVR